jgi:hypothetical protein
MRGCGARLLAPGQTGHGRLPCGDREDVVARGGISRPDVRVLIRSVKEHAHGD